MQMRASGSSSPATVCIASSVAVRQDANAGRLQPGSQEGRPASRELQGPVLAGCPSGASPGDGHLTPQPQLGVLVGSEKEGIGGVALKLQLAEELRAGQAMACVCLCVCGWMVVRDGHWGRGWARA